MNWWKNDRLCFSVEEGLAAVALFDNAMLTQDVYGLKPPIVFSDLGYLYVQTPATPAVKRKPYTVNLIMGVGEERVVPMFIVEDAKGEDIELEYSNNGRFI